MYTKWVISICTPLLILTVFGGQRPNDITQQRVSTFVKKQSPKISLPVQAPVAFESESSTVVYPARTVSTERKPVTKMEANEIHLEQTIKELDDANLLPYFVAIVGNFAKLFLDKHNTPNVIACVGQIIDSVIAVAKEVTRSTLPPEKKMVLASAILDEITRVVRHYKYVQHRPLP